MVVGDSASNNSAPAISNVFGTPCGIQPQVLFLETFVEPSLTWSVRKSRSVKQKEMKKALRETQTLCAGSSKAEPKNFRPAADPFPGGAGWPKFYQLEMVTTFTYKPSLMRIDASI